MNSYLSIIAAAILLLAGSASAFAVGGPSGANKSSFVPSVSSRRSRSSRTVSTTSSSKLNMIFGPKDDGSPGDYVCLDCGYVFTKGPEAWAKLPNDWSCPPCGSVKRRFKKVPKGSASGKVEVKGGQKKKGMFGM